MFNHRYFRTASQACAAGTVGLSSGAAAVTYFLYTNNDPSDLKVYLIEVPLVMITFAVSMGLVAALIAKATLNKLCGPVNNGYTTLPDSSSSRSIEQRV